MSNPPRWIPLALMLLLSAVSANAQNVQGAGQRASDLFALPAGLATFEIRYTGTGPFSARLLDEEGEVVEELARATGPFAGSKAVRIPRDGRYLYDVGASGPWEIRLRGGAPPAGPPVPVDMEPVYAGQIAARGVATVPWLAAGLAGGLVAGPLGAGIAFAAAASRGEPPLPADGLAAARARGGRYEEVFSDAYRQRVRSNRKTAALVGGATGTLVWAAVLVTLLVDWDSGGGGGGGGGSGGGTLP